MARSETERAYLAAIGKKVREVRLAKQIQQRAVAAQLGLSTQNLWRLENRGANLTIYRLMQIAKLLDVNPNVLLRVVVN